MLGRHGSYTFLICHRILSAEKNNVHISLRNRQALYKTEGNDVLT